MKNRNMDYTVKTSRSSDDKLTVTIGTDLEKLWQLRLNERSLEDWVRVQMLMLGGVEEKDGRVEKLPRKHLTDYRECEHCANPCYRTRATQGDAPADMITMNEFIGTLHREYREALKSYYGVKGCSAAQGLAGDCTGSNIGLGGFKTDAGMNVYNVTDLQSLALPLVLKIVANQKAIAHASVDSQE